MSSVQQRRCSNGFWKVKNRDMAVEEIIRDRRAAIRSGKLRQRRLFAAAEGACEVELDWNDDEICSDLWNRLQESEVYNEELVKSQDDMVTYFDQPLSAAKVAAFNEKVEEEGEMKPEEDVVEKGVRRNLRGGGGERCSLALAWSAISIVSMLVTICLVFMSFKYVLEKEPVLIPT